MDVSRMKWRSLAAALLVPVIAVVPLLTPQAAIAEPATPAYDIANGCFAMSAIGGAALPGKGPSTAKAAALGKFLFYDTAGTLLTAKGSKAVRTATPTDDAIWKVDRTGSTYRFTSTKGLTRAVRLTPATGCRAFPEAQVDVNGPTQTGTDADGRLQGFVDSHAHLMAEQFLGGRMHCGRPFSPLGITVALADCPDHRPDGIPAVSEHILSRPGPHDTKGWPTFKGYPAWYSLTHEQTYYKWIERTWRSGLRVLNNYYVQNRVLCEIYPLSDEPCNEMESVRIQHRRLLQLRDYIDAQAGGPGKGFFQIATNSQELRRIVASGKLAVTLGIEISEPFGCGAVGGRPLCSSADIDRGLDELHGLGVRQVILTHKFDNALGGARMDGGLTGVGVEIGQVYAGGGLWQVGKCPGHTHDNDAVGRGSERCNVRGLTRLGEYAVRATIKRNMVVDVDHLSAKSSDRALDIVSALRYPGVVSSHSWTDELNYRRIMAAGGVVGLYGGETESFIDEWREARKAAPKDRPFGLGFGPDMNGLGAQAPPRKTGTPVTYPFTMPNGAVVSRQRTGVRVFDVTKDGTAHYGLLPDWIQGMRLQAGADGATLVADLYRAAESYAAMWERVEAYRP
ncbi:MULTISPECIES: sphingolipid ceramide N-deacylase [Gordonia]|uniref:sphingolipid ceramide N-deacylase n=1 Tax=Gordonia TaxID=2053 RepID=UPI0030FE48BC